MWNMVWLFPRICSQSKSSRALSENRVFNGRSHPLRKRSSRQTPSRKTPWAPSSKGCSSGKPSMATQRRWISEKAAIKPSQQGRHVQRQIRDAPFLFVVVGVKHHRSGDAFGVGVHALGELHPFHFAMVYTFLRFFKASKYTFLRFFKASKYTFLRFFCDCIVLLVESRHGK